MNASAVLLRGGGANFPDVLGLVFVLGPALVAGGLFFGLLLGTVFLSRSTGRWSRGAAILLSLAFLLASILVVRGPALATDVSPAIGEAALALVALASLLLVIVVAMRSSSSLVEVLARWSFVIIASSLLLGVVGLVGFSVLNIPVQEMGFAGIGPGNRYTFTALFTLRNAGPIAISLVAAALGAAAWRATGRLPGAAATLLGCAGVGVNLVLLFLQSGD